MYIRMKFGGVYSVLRLRSRRIKNAKEMALDYLHE